MKEYKYTIDGVEYKVEIGEIVDNVAEVTVNGEAYKVEMEPEKEPEKKKVGKVTAICVKTGESVMEDAPLVVIE